MVSNSDVKQWVSTRRYCVEADLILVLQVDPSMRSMMALQEERGTTSYSELQSEVTRRSLTQPLESKPSVLKWSRMPGQVGGIKLLAGRSSSDFFSSPSVVVVHLTVLFLN